MHEFYLFNYVRLLIAGKFRLSQTSVKLIVGKLMTINIIQPINRLVSPFKLLPEDIIAIIARLAIATVFWRSAQTKINDWEFLGQHWNFININDSTFMLFNYEYGLPLIDYKVAAYMATFSEFFLSLAILAGLFTRFSALAFLVMTAVIQFYVYPDAWPTHILWAAILFYLIKHGSGRFSVDKLTGIH